MSDDLKPELARAPKDEPPRWLDERRNVDKVVYGVYGLSAFLILIDVFIEKHGPFAIEHLFGFYAFYSFIGCVLLVLAANGLRKLVMRSEDYYDR